MNGLMPLLDASFVVATQTVTRELLHRVYWAGQDPLKPSVEGNHRYDCPPGSVPFGVLYLGMDLPTCWMETVVRHNMTRAAGAPIAIPLDKMQPRWACDIACRKPLRLAQFADEPLIDLGDCATNIMADSYFRTRTWAALLHMHANPAVDGLRYRSRFKSDRFCIALFDRAMQDKGLTVSNTRSIDPAQSFEAQSIMRRYNVVPI